MTRMLLAPGLFWALQTLSVASFAADAVTSTTDAKPKSAAPDTSAGSWTGAEAIAPAQVPSQAKPAQPAVPAHAAPPPARNAQPQPVAPPAESVEGQWVYSSQYGWVWIPYAQAYTYVTPAGAPYEYVYYPTYGWCWVYSPWVFGWGPMPYWGIYGRAHFAWYSHPWFARPVYRGGVYRGGVYRGGVYHGGVYRGGVYHGGAYRGGVYRGGSYPRGGFGGGGLRGGGFGGGGFRGGGRHGR
jgi:hypothetical protein